MKYLSLLMLSAIFFYGCQTKPANGLQSLSALTPVILEEKGPALFQYWELKNEPFLWGDEVGAIDAIQAYKDSVQSALGAALYQKAVQKEGTQDIPKTTSKEGLDGDAINALLIHNRTIGKVRKINFLEAQVLNYQASRYPLFSKPTEFHGFIAVHDSLNLIRVYFGASDTEWPPKPNVLINDLKKAMAIGWRLKYHLHNHYCKADKNYIGIMAPSLADAQYFKMLKANFKVEKALITNGIHTVEIKNDAFEKFESH